MKIIRRWMLGLTAASIALSTVPPSVQAAGAIRLEINGQIAASDAAPSVRNGRVMVPLRWLAETLRADVQWDPAKRTVFINTFNDASIPPAGNGRSIALWANGRKLTPDVPPVVSQGRVLVSVRVAAEALGAKVTWVPERRLVRIEKLPFPFTPIQYVRFTHPAGWGFGRSYGSPSDERQQAIDRSLDRLSALLRDAETVDAAPLAEPVRRMDVHMSDSQDDQGRHVSGGFFSLVLSADGALARVDTSSHGIGTLYLKLPGGDMLAELQRLESALPAPFPARRIAARPLPDAALTSRPAVLEPVEHTLPPVRMSGFAVDPDGGGYYLVSADDETFPVWTSPDGTNWTAADPAAFGNLEPSAIGFGAKGSGIRLLSSKLDFGIYRSVDGGPWERVWEYPYPEANYKYAPIRYVADPANVNRIYAAFYHSSSNPMVDGAFLSEDGGRTWIETGVNGDPMLRFGEPFGHTPDPGNDGSVMLRAHAATFFAEYPVGTGHRVFASADAGRSWMLLDGVDYIYGSAPGANGTIHIGSRTVDGVSYLVSSRDGGATWEQRKLPFLLGSIHFDPAAPDLLFAQEYDPGSGGIYVSFDGGATWSAAPAAAGGIVHVDAAKRWIFTMYGDALKIYRWQ